MSTTTNLRQRRRRSGGGGDNHDNNDHDADNNNNMNDRAIITTETETATMTNHDAAAARQEQQTVGNNNNNNNNISSPGTTNRKSPIRFRKYLWIFLHLLAIAIYIAGLILQRDLHSSVECDMTYSQRQLIPIDIRASEKRLTMNPHYHLYKFVDQRDPRPHHRAMLQQWMKILHATNNDNDQATQLYLQQARQEKIPLNQHCTKPSNTTVAVLYIPGHWGSYMQSRSIGAHGIQLTGARDYQQVQHVLQSLSAQNWRGMDAPSPDEFMFDVYAVDFQEEGAALHAQFLIRQTVFVAQAIQHLASTCRFSQIVLLGHSIGGYVARLAPILFKSIQPYVQNIVTLGSPHAHPVFAWEESVPALHQQYLLLAKQDEPHDNNYYPALVAISGGLRDEMIPPVACRATHIPHSLSLLAPEIMKPTTTGLQPQLGMDHRAIVWCHNLLSVTRDIIYGMVHSAHLATSLSRTTTTTSPKERLQQVQVHLQLDPDQSITDYGAMLQQHHSHFLQVYGFWSSMAMETAMLYHLELLAGMVVVLGCFQMTGIAHLFPTTAGNTVNWILEIAPLTATIYLSWGTNYQIHVVPLIVLALVARAVLWLLQFLLGVGLPYILVNKKDSVVIQLKRIRIRTVGTFLVCVGIQCVGKAFFWSTRLCFSFIIAVYGMTISTAMVMLGNVYQPSSTNRSYLLGFLSTFLVVGILSTGGKVFALISALWIGSDEEIILSEYSFAGISTRYLPSSGLLKVAWQLFLPTALKVGFWHGIPEIPTESVLASTLRVAALGLAIFVMGPSLFQVGQGYKAGDLLSVLTWLEFGIILLHQALKTFNKHA